jgi:predicted DNA-binding protein with PD1-like motif
MEQFVTDGNCNGKKEDKMDSKLINESPNTLAIIFDAGDEVMEGLKKAALEYKLAASHFTAIGAFQEVALGFSI